MSDPIKLSFGVVLCLGLGHAIWMLWYEYKKPRFLSFFMFKWLCSIGKKVPLGDIPPESAHIFKFKFADEQYESWLTRIQNRGKITQTEFFHFHQQLLLEIDAEFEYRQNN